MTANHRCQKCYNLNWQNKHQKAQIIVYCTALLLIYNPSHLFSRGCTAFCHKISAIKLCSYCHRLLNNINKYNGIDDQASTHRESRHSDRHHRTDLAARYVVSQETSHVTFSLSSANTRWLAMWDIIPLSTISLQFHTTTYKHMLTTTANYHHHHTLLRQMAAHKTRHIQYTETYKDKKWPEMNNKMRNYVITMS